MTEVDWRTGWQERLRTELAALGASSVSELVRSRPASSLSEIASEFGGRYSETHLIRLIFDDVTTRDEFVSASADVLARHICAELRQGWGEGFRAREKAAAALSLWLGDISEFADAIGIPRERLRAAASWLMREVPRGWRPTGGGDEVIARAFAEAGV